LAANYKPQQPNPLPLQELRALMERKPQQPMAVGQESQEPRSQQGLLSSLVRHFRGFDPCFKEKNTTVSSLFIFFSPYHSCLSYLDFQKNINWPHKIQLW
jgi:hypothetical protein